MTINEPAGDMRRLDREPGRGSVSSVPSLPPPPTTVHLHPRRSRLWGIRAMQSETIAPLTEHLRDQRRNTPSE